MPNNNLQELSNAEHLWPLSTAERYMKMHQLLGALSQLVDAKTWAMALNTTYGYIKEVEDARTYRLHIAHMLSEAPFSKFRIVEKVETIDGIRDRLTNRVFATLEKAEEFINAELDRIAAQEWKEKEESNALDDMD